MSGKARQKRANMLEKFMYGKSEKAVEAAAIAKKEAEATAKSSRVAGIMRFISR